MRIAVIIIFVFLGTNVIGQYDHKDIYPGVEGDELRVKLLEEYNPTAVQSYTDAREFMFKEVYNQNDTVTTVYSGMRRYLDPTAEEPIQYFLSGDNDRQIDTEHSYPRSKGALKDTDAGSDLHHLFPSRKLINSSRANLPFGEVNDAATIKWYLGDQDQTSIPVTHIDDYAELGGIAFEPRESQKGNIARAIFYFYTMYRDMADQADPQFFDIMKDDLCEWHFADPVDSLEWIRSLMIGEFQGHEANPFVLDCSLASRLYCDQITDACAFLTDIQEIGELSSLQLFPNPFLNEIYVNQRNTSEVKYRIMNMLGQQIDSGYIQGSQALIVTAHIPSGIYFIVTQKGEQQQVFKMIKN